MRPSRAELEQHVDALAAEHSGEAFAAAVRAYAEELDEDAQAELKAILLRRARVLEEAVGERFETKGWLRRSLDRMAAGEARRRRGRADRQR